MNKKTRLTRKKNPARLRCPYCGSPVQLRSADGIYQNNSDNAMLYVCQRYPACDAYVRAHPGTNQPMGDLANGDLRALRCQAHRSFDQLHQSGRMSRDAAYRWLSARLSLPLDATHIGSMGEYYCRQVIEACETLGMRSRRIALKPRSEASGGVSA